VKLGLQSAAKRQSKLHAKKLGLLSTVERQAMPCIDKISSK